METEGGGEKERCFEVVVFIYIYFFFLFFFFSFSTVA